MAVWPLCGSGFRIVNNVDCQHLNPLLITALTTLVVTRNFIRTITPIVQSTVLSDPQLSLDGDLKELERLAVWIRQFCERHGLGVDVDFRLNLVLEELFTNAVRHGGSKGMIGAASIRMEARDGHVLVEYADRGSAFDPADAPAPDLSSPLEERRVGGLGLHFVRQMTSEFEYHRVGEWNRITMRLTI